MDHLNRARFDIVDSVLREVLASHQNEIKHFGQVYTNEEDLLMALKLLQEARESLG